MVLGQSTQTAEEEEGPPPPPAEKLIPREGSLEWILHWGELEGHLPSPIDVSITDSTFYSCPELIWYNFDVYPHKVKLTNTGYTLVAGAKWKAERPFLVGGPLIGEFVFSQVHFHWGPNLLIGSDHSVDKRKYPGEMQVTFFRSEYMTQEEALKHHDGVVMVCYIIKHGVLPDERLDWVIEGFPRIIEAQTSTRIGPLPMGKLLPMFYEDYFVYWGALSTVKGDNFAIRWLVPRITLFATMQQMNEFRKLGDPWDEPNLQNFRPIQERQDRHVFFCSPHWSTYNSLLPIPRIPEESISILSPAYTKHPWLLPPQNAYNPPEEETHKEVEPEKTETE